MIRVVAAALVLAFIPGTAITQVSPAVHPSIRAAANWAERHLTHRECRLLFTDFADASGRTLQANLEAMRQSAEEHFRALIFTAEDRSPVCRSALAFTSPASPVIHLCREEFTETARQDPRKAGAILIHEQLHALGLGENPPSSAEITQRVLQRCGR